MKFVSWNVNGLRACLKKGFLESFAALDADVFCLQETKLQPGQIDLDLPGYRQYWNSAESLILCTIGTFILSPNTYLMHFKKDQLPQYKFAEFINKTEDPSLLNYGFLDGGFYLAADIIPEQRYFCCNNMNLDEMIKSQQQCANDGIPDFIVTRSYSGTHPDFPLYTCVAEEAFPYYDQTLHYFLFRRN